MQDVRMGDVKEDATTIGLVEKPKTKAKTVCAGLSLALGLCLVIGGLLVLFHFRSLVEKVIESKLALRSDSATTEAWLDPPVKPLIRFYFFNVTNPNDFLAGAKPRLLEVGPYVYEQKWSKENVQWLHDGEAVQYEPTKYYYFRRDLSIGSESDTFTLPNVPMITSIGGKIRYAGRLVRLALGSMLDILQQKPFVGLSVRDVLWGYDNPLIKLGNDILPPEEKLPFDKFGIFLGKNGSSLGVLKVVTGLRDVQHVGQILSYNGKLKLDYWKGQCNDIKGTDGSVFPPGVTRNDTLHIFNKQLCQSLPLVYQEDIEANGIPGYRFVPPVSAFATPQTNPLNDCFCVASDGCHTPSGLFNLSQCQYGAPLMLSWPHFFQADRRLLNTVDGLNPSKEKHQFFIDVLPQLGKPLRAQARTQLNVVMKRVEGIRAARGLRDIILPMVWFADGIDGIEDEDTLALLRTAVFTPEKARNVMYPILLTLGGSILLASLAFFAKKYLTTGIRWKLGSSQNLNGGIGDGANRSDSYELKAYKNKAFSEVVTAESQRD